ncbi:hypothetical protein L6452_38160 [Arctium lappa]|uniref:Uncharacterized protein n=1 Tax=Arctium lappa TaxID=4217 RepID=A0ACB8Y5L1_ARCLA|nr:hypothetical protein L6452_38160 [Arctium lappa]
MATDQSKDDVSDQFRPWIDLPRDILSQIIIRLTLIDLLSFRGTCKDFRSATSGASAQIQSSLPPWILLFNKNDHSECILYNDRESKTYKRKIPDLEGVICLASYQGWLLLFNNGSVFFFCPVSLVKIRLPDFPHRRFDGHVASFSDVPTSPDCIVTVINRVNVLAVEVNVISKGQKSWTKHVVPHNKGLSTMITAAMFDGKSRTFYYMDDAKSLLLFSVNDKKWKPCQIVESGSKNSEPLPYRYIEDVFLKKSHRLRGPLEVEDDEDIALCGFTDPNHSLHRPALYLNEYIDGFCDSTSLRRAVWIQPRFFEADRNHDW